MESILALAWAVLYFAVPVNALSCFLAARRLRSDKVAVASLLCLGVWVGVTAFTIGYALWGSWYGEQTSLASNIATAVVAALMYLVMPAALIAYLRALRRSLPPPQPGPPPADPKF